MSRSSGEIPAPFVRPPPAPGRLPSGRKNAFRSAVSRALAPWPEKSGKQRIADIRPPPGGCPRFALCAREDSGLRKWIADTRQPSRVGVHNFHCLGLPGRQDGGAFPSFSSSSVFPFLPRVSPRCPLFPRAVRTGWLPGGRGLAASGILSPILARGRPGERRGREP